MPTGPNPFFYTDPTIGRAASGLASIFAPPDPARLAMRARADLYGVQADMGRAQLAGRQALADRFQAGLGEDRAAGWRDIFAAAASTGNPDIIRNTVGLFAATQGVPESELGRIVVGGGGDWGRTEGGTRFTEGTRAETTRRGQDVAAGATLGATRIRADSSIEEARIGEEGRDRRFAVTVRPGDTVFVPPNSPVAPRGDAPEAVVRGIQERRALDPNAPDYEERIQEINNRVMQETMPGARPQPIALRGDPRPQTFDQARAAEAERYIAQGATPEERDRRRREVAAPGPAAATIRREGRDGEASPMRSADQRTIAQMIQAQAATLRDAEGNTLTLAPEAQTDVQRRAADLFRSSEDPEVRGNHAEAVARAIEEFLASNPRRTDSSWNPFSARTLAPARRDEGGAQAPATTQQRLQQLGIPPPAQREVGRTYDTPRGPMVWTGTGWRPAS